MVREIDTYPKQLVLPDENFAPIPVVVSASRRTELVGLKPKWLVRALQRFPQRFGRDIHSVVLWTKDPTNIYEHPELRQELSKHSVVVHSVPLPEVLLKRLPKVLDFLGEPQRLRWRFDPIVSLQKEDGSIWSNMVYFENLAKEMNGLGINNCYFSFCQIYRRKFLSRQLEEAGIRIVTLTPKEKLEVVDELKKITTPLGIALYACVEPTLEKIPGIIPAQCIDADLLTELHPQKIPADPRRDRVQSKWRSACYCTESRDIGGYFPCGHGCVYCYAEAAIPLPEKLRLKPLPC